MNPKICTTLVFLGSAVVLSGCGFKSGLSLPDSGDNPLFVSDAEIEMKTAEQVAGELAMPVDKIVVADEIMLDKVTTQASDALILTDPTAVMVDGEIVDSAVDGVVVDLTDLEKQLEKQRNNQ